MGDMCCIFNILTNCLLQNVFYYFTFPSAVFECSICCIDHKGLVFLFVLNLGQLDRCVRVSRGFNLRFPNDQCCWASFHVLICHPCIYELLTCCACFLIGLFQLLSFCSSLYILDTNPLSDMWFAYIVL